MFAAPKVNVAKKGTYVYWITFKDPSGAEQTTLPKRFKGKSTSIDTVDLGTKPSNVKLFVMDRKTGNTAIVDYKLPTDSKSAQAINVKADDFQYVRDVKLRIVSEDGAPVESAIVNMTDGMGTSMSSILTPADDGVAEFQNVATGTLNIKVQAAGLRKTIDSDIDLSEKRDTAGFEHNVRVSGDVDTIAGVAKAEKSEAKSNKAAGSSDKEARSSGGGSIFQALAGLIFLVVVGAVIWAVIKAKGITAESALKKMGVDLPSGNDASFATTAAGQAAPAIDPNICEFCGQRKAADGTCACSVTPGASLLSSSPSTASLAGPRLIGVSGTYSGHIFEFPKDSITIGRDPGSDVSLSNDSTVSRLHATISKSNGDCHIRDEGSSNGTYVNGVKIAEQKISAGDELQIGSTKFRFEA